MKEIIFTKHAIKRARQRGLLNYVDGIRFWNTACFVDSRKARIGRVYYAYRETRTQVIITTIYQDLS